ncbi:hypothetical protein ACKZDW_02575 (plasmid) [Ralstonia syzygii subsp. celebesensis]|uniref:glycine-rich domain-containing protein n=1 Tax=Ralstonia syzygii TaxID=28097 RepID=UPI00387E1610
MAIQNDFLPFATASGANVVTQAQYAALAALSTGYQSGVAPSAQLNKTWRQSSIMAAVLAQFIADNTGQNATDDGTTATLEANLLAAIRSATKTSVILADTGTANAYTAVNVPPLTSSTWSDGVFQEVKIAHSNTGASTYAPDGLTAIPVYGLGLQPLQGGELFVGGTAVLMHATIAGVNSGNPIAVLMECAGGAQQVAPATQSQHAMQLGQATGRLLNVRVFTSSTTYTPTAGTNSIEVDGIGGGGAGGGVPVASGSNSTAGGGGSAGTWGRKRITSGFSGVAITIGAGGTGSANAAGGNGGTTSFGSLLTLPGGGGGAVGTVANSASMNAMGGPMSSAATGADVSSPGAVGLSGIVLAATVAYSGQGANSQFGAGGGYAGANSTYVQTGTSASGCGSGGAGAIGVNSGVTAAGGNGAPGLLIIREYS